MMRRLGDQISRRVARPLGYYMPRGDGYIQKVMDEYGPISYWVQGEAPAIPLPAAICQVNVLQNGAYTGVELGQDGIGDTNTSPLYDGINDYLDVTSPTFDGAFGRAEGTLLAWCRVWNAAMWTDGATYYALQGTIDGVNLWYIRKYTTNNTVRARVVSAGAGNNSTSAAVGGRLDFWTAAITYSLTAGSWQFYLAGLPVGAAMPFAAPFAAGPVVTHVIGAQSLLPTNPWHGWEAHVMYFDYAIPPAGIADISVV